MTASSRIAFVTGSAALAAAAAELGYVNVKLAEPIEIAPGVEGRWGEMRGVSIVREELVGNRHERRKFAAQKRRRK